MHAGQAIATDCQYPIHACALHGQCFMHRRSSVEQHGFQFDWASHVKHEELWATYLKHRINWTTIDEQQEFCSNHFEHRIGSSPQQQQEYDIQ